MKINEVAYQKIEKSLYLGDGYTLEYKIHPMEYESNTWKLMKNNYKEGEITITFQPQLNIPSVQSINFEVKGYGGKAIRALVNFYGGLTSDPYGNTNENAVKMWERLDAEKIPDSKRVRGYYFQLLKK